MFKEEWILSDGRTLYQVIHEGDLESDIEYQLHPYYCHWDMQFIYPIPNVTLIADDPSQSITHKLTNIK